jgi:hypothetical protein
MHVQGRPVRAKADAGSIADLGALSVLATGEHDPDMKRDVRAPVIRLLTVSQAAVELGVTPVDVDRLVETGDLHAVNVSPHGGRRFWPADVDACASGLDGSIAADVDRTTAIAVDASASVIDLPSDSPATPVLPPHRARAKIDHAPMHPRWPRYEVATERPASSYLAFRDAEHVTQYLRARQTLDVDLASSVHGETKRPAELVSA